MTTKKTRDSSTSGLKTVLNEVLTGWANDPFSAMDRAKQNILATTIEYDSTGEDVDLETEGELLVNLAMSASVIPNYATVERTLAKRLCDVVERIERYIGDVSQTRPLNFLMIASPGAGKSHMIECIAKKVQAKGVQAITFNMASLTKGAEMMQAIDVARNLKINDRFPIVFLDEFDTDLDKLPMLLPLLWDGKLQIGQRDLRMGRSIFFLAGSHPELPDAIKNARSMQMQSRASKLEEKYPKLLDLLSRINGDVVIVPEFRDREQTVDRRADKVCIAVHLLRRRFGKQLTRVHLGLLRFIATVTFRYDVRSITQLIDCIDYREGYTNLTVDSVKSMPLGSPKLLAASSLAAHLTHHSGPKGISNDWNKLLKCEQSVCIADPSLDGITDVSQISDTYRDFLIGEICANLTVHDAK